jgi:hypothetical protein
MTAPVFAFTPAPKRPVALTIRSTGAPHLRGHTIVPPPAPPKLTFTRFTTLRPSILSKRFTLAGGVLHKWPGGQLAEGRADKISVDIAGFAELLPTLGPHQALTFGAPNAATNKVVVVAQVESAYAASAPDADTIIARTADYLFWPDGPGVLMVDYDAPATGAPLSREGLIAALETAAPALAQAATIWRPSASSCIFTSDGKELRGIAGQRIYLPVLDAADIPRAGRALADRLWLAGYGRIDLSGSGALLERTVVDGGVWQTERLDFAGGAWCGPGLEQRLPAPLLINADAGYLDSRIALPDLSATERAQLAALKEDAKAARAVEAAAVREIWIGERVESAVARLTPEQRPLGTRERITRAYREAAAGGNLGPDVVIHVAGLGDHSVKEILAHPETYHDRECRDPLEPGYLGDNRIGWINTRATPAYIYSHAHGGQRFYLGEPVELLDFSALLARMGAKKPDVEMEPALPSAWQPDPTAPVTLAEAESQIAALIQDVIANPRDVEGLLRIVVINATVGVGKTKIAIDEFKRDATPVIWFSGTHAKSGETETDFNAGTPRTGMNQYLPWPAKAIRGRGAPLEVGDEGRVYCQKPDALKALTDARLGQYAKSLLCINTHSQCPHLKDCDYFQQFNVASDCRILTHDYLIHDQAQALRFDADIAVIDESPIHCLLLPKSIIWSDVVNPKHKPISAWLKTAVGRAVYGAVMDDVALPPEEVARLLQACDEELAAFENEGPAVQPWMDNESAAATIGRWQPVGDMAVRSVLLASQRYLAGDVNTLWRGCAEKKPALFSRFAHVPTALRKKAVLILDATADADIYRAALAGIRDKKGAISHAVEFHNIVVVNAPCVTVTQVIDQTFYRKKLVEGLSAKKMAARVAGFIALAGGNDVIVNRYGGKQSPVGFISNKEFVRAVTAKTGCESLNFNALSGMNSLQDCRIGVVAGRIEPGALDLESAARALWPREALNCTGVIEKQRSGYRTADDNFQEGAVRGHADPRVDAVLRQTRDAELVQAIGRFRLVRSTEAKQIFVLGNTPISGLTVDHLITTDQLLPDWRLAEALLAGHGTALLSATWLAENCRDAFPNPNAAKAWLIDFKGSFPGEYISYPETYLSKLKEVTYFLEGQRGGRGRRAVTSAPNLKLATGAIESLIGTSVRKICWSTSAQEEVAAGASVEVAAAPVAEPAGAPNPFTEEPVMTSLRPSDDPPTPIPPGVGNIRWLLGCAFDADWETPLAPHSGMECETRWSDWRVKTADGGSLTVRTASPQTAAEFWPTAPAGARYAAPIRDWVAA